MNKDLELIKKKYGERMSRLCRELFPILLETEGLLPEILLSNFEPSHILYDDLLKDNLIQEFKAFIYSKVENKENELVIDKTPSELLSEAGYDLYECFTEEDIQSFKKYYAPDEELCTFNGRRLNRCRVFFAVKKDVDQIKREDFPNPLRQDRYGTSVISIQFTKDGTNTLSIKNRYNHRVENPDATFSNDLDNIIAGLTKSFEIEYGLVQKYKSGDIEIPGYVKANDGKYYKFNYEINNIYYCPDNVIIDNFEVKRFSKDNFIVLDYFILDLKRRVINLYDKTFEDAFTDMVNNISQIKVTSTGKNKEITIIGKNGENITLVLDKANRIIELKSLGIKIGDRFLYYNGSLTKASFPNLQIVSNDFLDGNEVLEEIETPKLETVGDYFLHSNKSLRRISFQSLREAGCDFLTSNEILEEIDAPKLETVGNYSLFSNKSLRRISLESLREAGYAFLNGNEVLEEIDAPKLETVEDYFLYSNKSLRRISLESLREAGYDFLYENELLEEIDAPKLETVGDHFLHSNKSLRRISFQSLREAGCDFLTSNEILEEIDAPKLETVGDYFLYSNKGLRVLSFESLRKVGHNFLYENELLEEMNAPRLKRGEAGFLESHPSLINTLSLKRHAAPSKFLRLKIMLNNLLHNRLSHKEVEQDDKTYNR